MTDHLRHWTENASSSQLVSAIGAVVVVAGFIATSIVLTPEGSTDVAAIGGVVPQSGSSVTTQAGGPRGTQAGGATPSSGGPAAGGATTGHGAGATSTDPGTAGGADGGAATSTAEPLVASDRGVTESTIKLGFLLTSSALDDAGFDTNQRGDRDQYIQALVDYANRRGGAAGREIVAATRVTDPTSTDDQYAACQSMLDDHQVFGVIDVAPLTWGPAQQCIGQEGETPFVHLVPWSREFQAGARGYDVAYPAAIDRMALTMVRDLQAAGWLDSNAVVGVFGDNCPQDKPTVDNVLVPALRELGVRVEVGLHDCTIDAAVRQPPNIATRFRTASVTHVILVSNYVSNQIFLQTAAGFATWHPRYAASDWWSVISDNTSRNYSPSQFDGAVGITSQREALHNSGRPPYAGIERCNEVAAEAGLESVDADDTFAHRVFCDLFFLMLDGINGAGPNPTRTAWAAAIQSLGHRDSAMWGPSSFGPGKTSGADQVYTAVWHRDCTCWRAESDFRPMAA